MGADGLVEHVKLEQLVVECRSGLNISRFEIASVGQPGMAVCLFNSSQQLFDNDESLTLNQSYGYIETVKLPEDPNRANSLQKHVLQPGEILVPLRFQRLEQFDAAIVPSYDRSTPWFVNNNVGVLTPNEERVRPEFLALCFRTSGFKRYLKIASQTSCRKGRGSRFSLALDTLLLLTIPIPSVVEQTEMVAGYWRLLRQKRAIDEQIQTRLTQLSDLF